MLKNETTFHLSDFFVDNTTERLRATGKGAVLISKIISVLSDPRVRLQLCEQAVSLAEGQADPKRHQYRSRSVPRKGHPDGA
jgi:hypothetical protein